MDQESIEERFAALEAEVRTLRAELARRDTAEAAEPMERELLTQLSRAEHAMLIELLSKLAGRP